MNRINRYKIDILWLVGFLFLPLLLYGAVSVGEQTMIPVDNLFQWEPWASSAEELGVGTPQNPLISDLLIENFAWKRFINETVQAGEIPLWSPALFGGAPFLATGQNAAYYPFSVLFLILPLTKAYGWFTVSQLWLAGALMYVLGRVLGVRREGAFLAGVVYQGCGFMLVSAAVFPMIIAAAAWLPLLLACVARIVRHGCGGPDSGGNALPWMVVGAMGLGCQLLAGHVEITYYTLLVMGAFAGWLLLARLSWRRAEFWLSVRRVLNPAGFLLSLVLMGLMLGAIQFIPLYEVADSNFREGSATFDEVRGWAFPPRRALTLVLPNFYGNPSHHSYRDVFSGDEVAFTTNAYGDVNPNGAESSDWGIKNYVEGGVYLGVLPLVLAGLGVASLVYDRKRRVHIRFFITLALFAVAFIFGTPLYAILYYGLPGINQLHSPFRWVFPLSLCVAALAGYGVDFLAGEFKEWRVKVGGKSFRPQTILPIALIGVGGVTLLSLLGSRLFYGALEPFIGRLFMGLAKAPEAFADTAPFYSYLFWQVGWLGVMLLVAGGVVWLAGRPEQVGRTRFNAPIWAMVAIVLVGADLFLIGRGFNAATDPALLDFKPELVSWLEAQRELEPGRGRLTTFTPHGDKPFNANVGWFYDFEDVRGYDSIIPKQYTEYMEAIEPQNELLFNRVQPIVNWQSLNSPLLDLLGVQFIITSEQIDLPKLQLVWQGEGLFVYENLAVVSRAVTMPQSATVVTDAVLLGMTGQDPRQFVFVEPGVEIGDWGSGIGGEMGPAVISAYGNVEVVVEAGVDERSWLVLHDSFAPGWKAFVRPAGVESDSDSANSSVEETEVTVHRVNGNFRGVLLEPGNWSVRFRYSPLSFKVGGLTSAMGGIILLFAMSVWFWRRFYNPSAKLSNAGSIAKNSMVPTLLNLLNRGIDFLFAAFYLRILGPADNGSYATAIAIAGWFEIVSNFGLNTLIIRDVSQDRSQASHYLLNTTILRVATTLVGALPIVVYIGLLSGGSNPLNPEIVMAILLIMVGMVFSGVGQSFTGLFYAYETAETPAAVATVTTILKVGLGVVALLLGQGFVGLAGVSILVNVITLAILAGAAFNKFAFSGPWRVDFPLQRRMVGQSYPLMLNHLLATVFFFIDVPLMRQINGEEAVGWYNTAYKWINAINVIPSFFTFALFPVISRQIQQNMAGAERTFRMSVKLMVLIALPISAVTMLLAPTLVLVLGGEAFLPDGAIALQIVIWSIPFGWINSVTNYVLIALGKERVQIWAFLAGVTFNFVANLFLLPILSYRGAALTTILSEVILLVLFSFYLRDRMPNVGWVGLLARPVLVTAGMGVAMVLGLQVHLVVGLVLGLVAYPAGLWALGVFGEDEQSILRSLLPERIASRLG